MNIIGPDQLIFGVEDLDEAVKMALDFGLKQVEGGSHGGVFEAYDGTSLKILHASDALLPAANAPSPNIRETLYGVTDAAALDAIGAELSKDREVSWGSDGILRSRDQDDYAISFAVTKRHGTGLPHYGVNVPGQAPGRAANVIAAKDIDPIRPLTLSHIVLFVHNKLEGEKFYSERLGFRTVDEFTNLGPFMRPQANDDHHTLFLIEVPFRGMEHFAFHVAGANELLKNGWDLTQKGYTSTWGPGRHILGSNYFWYFNSPFGCKWEIDADMDKHDDNWEPRRIPSVAETSQTFHFKAYRKYHPTEDLPHISHD